MTSGEDEMRARLLPLFTEEADQQIAAIRASLAAVGAQGGMTPEAAAMAMRAAHSLAGASAAMGLGEVSALARAMESVLDRAARGRLVLGADFLEALRQGADLLADLLAGRPGAAAAEVAARLARSVSGKCEKPRLGR
jgi:chemotaxis protein histidine kinase CheA